MLLRTIIAHEVRLLLKSPATAFLLALLAAAILFGGWNGYRAVERQHRSAATAVAQEAAIKQRVRDELAAYERYTQERGIPRQFAPVSHTKPRPGQAPQGTNAGAVGGELLKEVAVLPPTGLSAFAVGQTDLRRMYTFVDMKNRFNMSDNHEIENPLNLMTGTFDISFVILFLLPIFILSLTYDMLSAEKESGTLALAMTQPVTLETLMAGKLLSRLAILMAVILAMGLCALALVAGTLGVLGEADTWARFALWIGAVVLYSLFWFSLGVLANALNGSSEGNATILAAGWLLLVVVVPALVGQAAAALYPAPSRMELKVALRDAASEAERAADETSKALYVDHVEMVTDDEEAQLYLTAFLARQIAMEESVAPVFDRFRIQQERQERFAGWLQYASPAIVMQRVLNEISGASTARYRDYMDQVYAFHAVWREYFTPRYLRREILHSSTYDDFPTFSYPAEPMRIVLGRVGAPVAGLLLIVAGLTGVAFARLRGFGVRENVWSRAGGARQRG